MARCFLRLCFWQQSPRLLHRSRETLRDGVNICLLAFWLTTNYKLQISLQNPISISPSKTPSILFILQKNRNLTSHGRFSLKKDATCRVHCSQVKIEDSSDDEACELVNGVELSIGEGVDSVDAYLLTAVKNNNGTGILLLSDIFGFQHSSTRDFAYRIACNGYNVLLPDLFKGDPWRNDRPKDSFEPWLASHNQRVKKDITMSIKWMVDEFVAAGISKKLGVVGFCFGGGKVIDVLALDQGVYFGTGVSFYGTRIDISEVGRVKVPILFVTGDEDPLCPIGVVEDVERNSVEGSRVVVFRGRGHGFVHRPASLEEDKDAEEAFMIMRNWLCNELVVEEK